MFAEREADLLADAAGDDEVRLDELTTRRETGEPLEYVVGWAEFCGTRFAVRPGVFVPRHRSEALVDVVTAHLANRLAESRAAPTVGDTGRLVLVDLCCGSGALGATIARRLAPASVELHAADLDPVAVACAAENLAASALDGPTWRATAGDLFDALDPDLRGRVDAILANVPYVPTADVQALPCEARDHEAPAALDGGSDGLDVLRRVAVEAPAWLAEGGTVSFELAPHQADAASAVLGAAGLVPTTATARPEADGTDDVDDETVVVSGRR